MQHNTRVAVLANTDKITDSHNSMVKFDNTIAKYYKSKEVPHDQWLSRGKAIPLVAFEKILLEHASVTTPAEGPLRYIYTKPRPSRMACDTYFDKCMHQMFAERFRTRGVVSCCRMSCRYSLYGTSRRSSTFCWS